MKLHVEKNMNTDSSFNHPFFLVNEDGKVIKRCKTKKEAYELKNKGEK